MVESRPGDRDLLTQGDNVTPRIPLPTDRITSLGIPDVRDLWPSIGPATRRCYTEISSMKGLDPVVTELVRMRNARFQRCFL
jgi:hypothetical protein